MSKDRPEPGRQAWWKKYTLKEGLIIMVIFAFTGASAVGVAGVLKPLFGMDRDTPFLVTAAYFVFVSIPMYQVLLLFWGFIFGRYRFFLEYEKKSLGRIFRRKKASR
ncbi:MAG TPA: hypothetical protein P5550_05620 [Bacteroidales bacterium]|nr:hypothetical protein [Bacteroidales bacterium]HRZ76563.1 hypothetical protein [Bacteroidales bacterium]